MPEPTEEDLTPDEEKGYTGRHIDPVENFAYTVPGVLAGEITPETAPMDSPISNKGRNPNYPLTED